MIKKKLNITKFCPDCGVKRGISKPGSCPCCFSKMEITRNTNTQKTMISICQNPNCQRICTQDFLSGFWDGWKQNKTNNLLHL